MTRTAPHRTLTAPAADPVASRRRLVAERQHRLRERRRHGRAAWTIELQENRLVEALLVAGIVNDEESRDRHYCERIIGEMIDDWSARALKIFP